MHNHGPNCLDGPLSRGRRCWSRSSARTKRSAATPSAIRRDLVERVRREIAAGTYDTPEKWQAALDRLHDQLDRE
jgi:hypothetical protein